MKVNEKLNESAFNNSSPSPKLLTVKSGSKDKSIHSYLIQILDLFPHYTSLELKAHEILKRKLVNLDFTINLCWESKLSHNKGGLNQKNKGKYEKVACVKILIKCDQEFIKLNEENIKYLKENNEKREQCDPTFNKDQSVNLESKCLQNINELFK